MAEGSLGVEIRSQEEDTPARRQLDGLSAWSRTPGAGKLADRPEHQDASGPSATRAATSFRIFLNYRREDASGHAGRLYDFLRHGRGEVAGFRKEQIFMDIDTIAPGVDFRRVIEDAVGSCDVFIAVMGRQWLDATDAHGRRRLDKGNDFVRLEIEAALARDIPVVPVLVQGAQMPSAEELPETLDDFAHRNAVELSDARWDYDVGRLTAWLSTLEEEKPRREQAERERQEQEERERREQGERKRLEKEAAERAERERLEAAKRAEQEQLEAAERAERDRKTREAAEQAERERLQKEAAQEAEQERLEREAVEKAERERLEQETAEREAAERRQREEAERQEAAERAERERERVAAEQAESAERKRLEAAKLAEQQAAEKEAAERAKQLTTATAEPTRRRIRLPQLKRRYWILIAALLAGAVTLVVALAVLRPGEDARSGGETLSPAAAQQQLLSHIPADVAGTCRRSEPTFELAAVLCTALETELVQYTLFEDLEAQPTETFFIPCAERRPWEHGEYCETQNSLGSSLIWTDNRFEIGGRVLWADVTPAKLREEWECCLQLHSSAALDIAEELRSLGQVRAPQVTRSLSDPSKIQ